MKLLSLILFLSIGAVANRNVIHPLYISTFEIKHNAKEKNVEISIRAFIDDVENAIKQTSKQNIDLSSTNKEALNKLINSYLQQKLQLSINNKPQTINYIGFEIIKESMWIYAEINDITTAKNMTINCNWLYDFTNKQSNIFSATYNGVEKNYKLDFPKNKVEFVW